MPPPKGSTKGVNSNSSTRGKQLSPSRDLSFAARNNNIDCSVDFSKSTQTSKAKSNNTNNDSTTQKVKSNQLQQPQVSSNPKQNNKQPPSKAKSSCLDYHDQIHSNKPMKSTAPPKPPARSVSMDSFAFPTGSGVQQKPVRKGTRPQPQPAAQQQQSMNNNTTIKKPIRSLSVDNFEHVECGIPQQPARKGKSRAQQQFQQNRSKSFDTCNDSFLTSESSFDPRKAGAVNSSSRPVNTMSKSTSVIVTPSRSPYQGTRSGVSWTIHNDTCGGHWIQTMHLVKGIESFDFDDDDENEGTNKDGESNKVKSLEKNTEMTSSKEKEIIPELSSTDVVEIDENLLVELTQFLLSSELIRQKNVQDVEERSVMRTEHAKKQKERIKKRNENKKNQNNNSSDEEISSRRRRTKKAQHERKQENQQNQNIQEGDTSLTSLTKYVDIALLQSPKKNIRNDQTLEDSDANKNKNIIQKDEPTKDNTESIRKQDNVISGHNRQTNKLMNNPSQSTSNDDDDEDDADNIGKDEDFEFSFYIEGNDNNNTIDDDTTNEEDTDQLKKKDALSTEIISPTKRSTMKKKPKKSKQGIPKPTDDEAAELPNYSKVSRAGQAPLPAPSYNSADSSAIFSVAKGLRYLGQDHSALEKSKGQAFAQLDITAFGTSDSHQSGGDVKFVDNNEVAAAAAVRAKNAVKDADNGKNRIPSEEAITKKGKNKSIKKSENTMIQKKADTVGEDATNDAAKPRGFFSPPKTTRAMLGKLRFASRPDINVEDGVTGKDKSNHENFVRSSLTSSSNDNNKNNNPKAREKKKKKNPFFLTGNQSAKQAQYIEEFDDDADDSV